jgi:hypothetical protein
LSRSFRELSAADWSISVKLSDVEVALRDLGMTRSEPLHGDIQETVVRSFITLQGNCLNVQSKVRLFFMELFYIIELLNFPLRLNIFVFIMKKILILTYQKLYQGNGHVLLSQMFQTATNLSSTDKQGGHAVA